MRATVIARSSAATIAPSPAALRMFASSAGLVMKPISTSEAGICTPVSTTKSACLTPRERCEAGASRPWISCASRLDSCRYSVAIRSPISAMKGSLTAAMPRASGPKA
jgi:hypothetical protein